MSEASALLVFAVIMGAALLVWAGSVFRALRIGREAPAADRGPLSMIATAGDERGAAVERGERTLRGDPERLSKELVRTLLQGPMALLGPLFEVVERTAQRVVVRKTGPLVVNQPPGLYFSEARFDFETRSGDEVRVRYALGFERLARRMRSIALWVVFGVGLPVLLGVGLVVWFLVLPSEVPAVRWQVLQCLQVVHALWPPFLVIYLYTLGRRRSRAFVENLLTTLEHVV